MAIAARAVAWLEDGAVAGRPVLTHDVHAQLLKALHLRTRRLQPAQERPDHPLVMAQRFRRREAALPVEPEVLIGGLDRLCLMRLKLRK